MSIAHRQTAALSSDGSSSIGGAVEDVGTAEHKINDLFASGTDVAYAFAFDGDTVQSFILLSSQDMTLKVNDATTPAATITLKAGMPRLYSVSSGYYANPFAGITVTGFYRTNAAAARLKVTILVS